MGTETSVLLASESSAARENFRVSFTKLGFRMSAVMSWRQASESVARENFQIVIADSKLADCSGAEFLQNYNKAAKIPSKNILLTDEVTGSLLASAKAARVSLIFMKPVVLARFEVLLRALIDLPPDLNFDCEIFPGASASMRKVAMAFMSTAKDCEALKKALLPFDVFILPTLQVRQGIQSWGMLKPDLTFVDKDITEIRGLDLIKGLRNAEKTAEIAILAREVDATLVKEISLFGVKNCLLWPLRAESANTTFAKYFVKKPELKVEVPVEKPKEEPLVYPSVKALLVESNSEGAVRTKEFLREMQFDVSSAMDSNSALVAWKQGKPGIIVSNYELGQGTDNGLELLRSIRKDDVKIPFVMTSQADCWHQIEEAQRLGCAGWLQKPYERDEIQRVVKKAMDAAKSGAGQWVKETKLK